MLEALLEKTAPAAGLKLRFVASLIATSVRLDELLRRPSSARHAGSGVNTRPRLRRARDTVATTEAGGREFEPRPGRYTVRRVFSPTGQLVRFSRPFFPNSEFFFEYCARGEAVNYRPPAPFLDSLADR